MPIESPCANDVGKLLVDSEVLAEIARHAEAAYPEECCGILVGRFGKGGGARVVRAVSAANVHADRRRQFAIAPEVLLREQKAARGEGLELVGYYHSHPDHPAVPSETDRRDAWPGVSYLIVAVAGGAAGEARSWRHDPASGEVGEEEVVQE